MKLRANHYRWVIASLTICTLIESSRAEVDFNQQIRPILSQHCITCHGPDAEDRQADFRVDVPAAVMEDRGGYAAIVAGAPDKSELIHRISSDDEDERMPPADHSGPLDEPQIALLRQWIAEGAKYERHWSFGKLTRPQVPSVTGKSTLSEIDRFVQARLHQSGLTPCPLASAQRQLRRVSLAITGLPPIAHSERSSQAKLVFDAFLQQPSEHHYEHVVGELLDSPAYGEHWAAMWLDLARYADSVGYAGDEERTIWPWRDWVITAFNDNMPFDQFTIEQLAGDLLPHPTESQRLATAFHRNTLINNEGGTNDEEFRTIAIKDRISTTMNVWMGLTMRCAECHSHKYDPISHHEYYAFLDYFNQTADADNNDERPRMDLYPKGRELELAELEAKIAEAQQKLDEQEPKLWLVQRPLRTESRDGTEFEVLDDDSILATGKLPDDEEYALTIELPAGTTTGIRLEAIPDKRNGGNVGRAPAGGYIISQVRATTADSEGRVIHRFSDAVADHAQVNYGIQHVIQEQPQREKGWAVRHPLDGFREHREAVFQFAEPIQVDEPTELTLFILHEAEWPRLLTGRVRLSTTSVIDPVRRYRDKELDPHGFELAQLHNKRGPVRVPVMEELPTDRRRTTHVMKRGNYRSLGEEVHAATPAAFPPMPTDLPPNRLGVARWLINPNNPLTARVTVNRFWAQLFGRGLVETEEDFGTQGSYPSHPDLLDWLAIDFQHDWDIKRLLKQIVMSHAFRQQSSPSDTSLAKDARNILLSHGPRYRLSAEVVRDQTLAVAGLLSRRLYGRPVFPPSPIKRIVNAFTGGMTWQESEGEDRYRRAIYTFLKRSQPHPLFATFDMASRDICRLRRFRTNTPLQSFMTLNDPAFIEAAAALANIMLESADESDSMDVEVAVARGLQRALSRPAQEVEIEPLTALYRQTLQSYADNIEQAVALTGRDKPEGAARTRSDDGGC